MTRVVFLDTETTSLRHDRRAWEVGAIVRDPGQQDMEYRWFIRSEDLDLGNADPASLAIGKFYERHPDYKGPQWDGAGAHAEEYVLRQVERLTRGAHLVGAVPGFDADVLGARMRAGGICPSWHYHLIDVEALAVGWMNGRRSRQNEIVDGCLLENGGGTAPGLVRWDSPGPWDVPLPWKSHDLTAALGVTVPAEDEHTALGDARWARAIYDAATGRLA